MSAVNPLWKSLEQAAQDPVFLASAAQEFPALARALKQPLERRQVMKLMAAALLMAGVSGCDSKYGQTLMPAVRNPSNIVPGLPNVFATAHVLDGYATGILVKHLMGRPIKVEGNPKHPASLGASSAFAQAQLLDFYDPDRAVQIAQRREPSDRSEFLAGLAAERTALASRHGKGFKILTGTVTSPTLSARLRALRQRYPEAEWIQWDPIGSDRAREAARLAYGQPLEMLAHLQHVDVLLAIDSDLLSHAPGHLTYARDFASRRNPTRTAAMSRIYAIEATPTLLGSVADHRFIAPANDFERLVQGLFAALVRNERPPSAPPWVEAVVADLKAARGRAFVHVGAGQPALLHAQALAVNEALGGRNLTYELIDPVAEEPADQAAAMRTLIAAMQAGEVSHLVMMDTNPVFTSPASWGFAAALERVPFSLTLAGSMDETAQTASWFVPKTHDWESWSDARAHDGTATVMQPQALPLYGGVSPLELLALYIEDGQSSAGAAEAAVKTTWSWHLGANFNAGWRDSLADGVVPQTAAARSAAPLRNSVLAQSIATEPQPMDALKILCRPHPGVWDGRFANNPWLQELPHALTKVVWDSPLLIAPALAKKLKVTNGDCVRVVSGQTQLVAPVWILPGQSPDAVTALLGYGRRAAGSVGTGVGVDYYPLTALNDPVVLTKEPQRVEIASTVHHDLLMGTPAEILRHGTLEQYQSNPRFAANEHPEPELYRRKPPGPAAWAMSVDLNACIGCNACIVACQAENNIPVVGKEQVVNEREMHWLRIDRYFEGAPDAPQSFFQPVLCMHCEQAPCENVCPVGATVHDAEGLNVMVYNRCVGTRFCSNNCPYKVRRFNFFGFAEENRRAPESWNPEVTVRARGVMEKCSYCVQRIAEARIVADRDGRAVGEVKTACQSACPAQAFTFGNLADAESEVAKRKQSPLDFAMLEAQATKPRTTYEALVRNPNPKIKAPDA
jgi:MoCo/4Fe-4S cofactor protein with predicted Tat translocation signal